MTIQEMNGHARKLGLAYERALLPLSKEVGMPQTAISMLLFLPTIRIWLRQGMSVN